MDVTRKIPSGQNTVLGARHPPPHVGGALESRPPPLISAPPPPSSGPAIPQRPGIPALGMTSSTARPVHFEEPLGEFVKQANS